MTATIEARLGELAPAYAVYKDTISAIPEDATVQVPYRPEMVADQLKAARDKLVPDTTFEEFTIRMEGAHSKKVPARRMALLEKGFAGTITDLFGKIMSVEELGGGNETGLGELANEINLHKRLPEERRLGAKVMSERGYYWAGQFNAFGEEQI